MRSIIKNSEQEIIKPLVVEIIGPAGAGKTTLFHLLKKFDPQFSLQTIPDVRSIANYPFFFKNAIHLIPILYKLRKSINIHLSRQEFIWILILFGWSKKINQKTKNNPCAIILDQGPVYLLTELREFGPASRRTKEAEVFWQIFFQRWASILDLIIWLDAADEDLLGRIRTRQKSHKLKNASVSDVHNFLAQYRTGFNNILSRIDSKANNIKIIRFNTSEKLPDEIVDCILSLFSIS